MEMTECLQMVDFTEKYIKLLKRRSIKINWKVFKSKDFSAHD